MQPGLFIVIMFTVIICCLGHDFGQQKKGKHVENISSCLVISIPLTSSHQSEPHNHHLLYVQLLYITPPDSYTHVEKKKHCPHVTAACVENQAKCGRCCCISQCILITLKVCGLAFLTPPECFRNQLKNMTN